MKKNESAAKFLPAVPPSAEGDGWEDISSLSQPSSQESAFPGKNKFPSEDVTRPPIKQDKEKTTAAPGRSARSAKSGQGSVLYSDRKILSSRVERVVVGIEPVPASIDKKFSTGKVDLTQPADDAPAAKKAEPKTNPPEKPGIIVKNDNSRYIYTGELTPLPTIISAEEEKKSLNETKKQRTEADRLRKIAGSVEYDENFDDPAGSAPNQLMFEGFINKPETRTVNEHEMEKELKRKRRETADNFKLFGEEEDGGEENAVSRIYTKNDLKSAFISDDENRRVRNLLQTESKTLSIKLAVTGTAGVIMLFAAVFVNFSANPFRPFGNSEVFYVLFNIILILITAAVISGELFEGVVSLIKLRPAPLTLLPVITSAALMQNVTFLIKPETLSSDFRLQSCAAAAVLMFLPILGAKYVTGKNALYCHKLYSRGVMRHSAENIRDKKTAAEIGKGILGPDPVIKYSARIKEFDSFLEQSLFYEEAYHITGKLIPASLFVSVMTGFFAWLKTGDFMAGISVGAAAAVLTAPISAGLSFAFALFGSNRALKNSNGLITGYKSLSGLKKTKAVCLDASAVIDSDDCNIYGIKPFHGMRIDDAILYTASMIIEAKGPLGGVFKKVILDKTDLLPTVEDFAYEERLGLSGWIHNRRVFVGNSKLLGNHGIKTPDESFEGKYTKDGRQIVYLAVENKLSAMFIVSYSVKKEMAALVRDVSKQGVAVLLYTQDPNITAAFVEKQCSLPENSIKILSSKSGEYFKDIKDETLPSVPAGLMCGKNAASFLNILKTGLFLSSIKKFISPVALASSLSATAFIFAAVWFSKINQLGSLQIAAFHIFWCAAACLLPGIIKKMQN
ncbi:MAG: hypothetical protein FWF08_01055 [Oscillospiraceae bacterium]|nr:hypothetical protein [Oscillospiraceae bacterium]